MTQLNPTATALLYSSFLGGSDADLGKGIAVDLFGSAYVTGQTCSTNFPTKRPLQATPAGNCDAFVAKIRVGPDIDIKPTTLDFGAQAVGTPTVPPKTLTIASIGEAPLDITAVSVTGIDAADFAIDPSNCLASSPLAVDASCTVSVTFTPPSLGPKTASLQITDNVDSGTHTVSLTGSGGALGVAPRSLTFPDQGVGTTSISQTVTMSNVGTTAITISSIAVNGDFSQANQCTTAINNILQPGATCTIDVTFTPVASGTRNGTLTITDSDPSSPQLVSLSGNGTAPAVSLLPAALSFPDTNFGVTSAPLAVTLSNTGSSVLLISSIATTGDFAKSDQCGASLVAGASCTINVTFTPTALGNRYGTLTVTDNAGNSPQVVQLAGNGLTGPVASFSPTSLIFANQPVNTTSGPQTVVLSNSGTATLNIATITVTGVNSGDFAQTNNCGVAVPAGGNCAIEITFSPTASGTRLAAIALADDAGSGLQSVGLSGAAGLAPWVTVSPVSLSFPDTKVGVTSAPLTVTLTNSGSATLLISSIATTGDFAKSDACGSSIAVGASCQINVTFTPTAVGNRYGTLTITDNAAGSPHVVQLAGNGLPAPLVTLAPTSLTFATRPVNTSSAAQTVVLTNTGSATLNITNIAASGDFAQTNTCGATLAAGASCPISVTFTPKSKGSKTATLEVRDNAGGGPQTVALSGRGTP